jgi:hypothetical protein
MVIPWQSYNLKSSNFQHFGLGVVSIINTWPRDDQISMEITCPSDEWLDVPYILYYSFKYRLNYSHGKS